MEQTEFKLQLKQQGYSEPKVHEFAAGNDIDMHTHDFSAMLLVLEGEFQLVLEDKTHHYYPGDWCELSAGTLHTEKTGADGATTLLARKPSA